MIEFGEWLPDLPDYMNPGATVAKNVIPAGMSYEPLGSFGASTSALSAACKGVTYGRAADGTAFTIAGDASTLYKLVGTSWSDVSKTGGYTVGTNDTWSFTKWGSQILAANINDPIQEFNLNSSSVFADLAASAPQAKHLGVVRDFVVAGFTFDTTDGTVPHRVRWCAIGDPTDWTVSATTQADYEDLDSNYGAVSAIVGGEFGTIFQEDAITRMTYVGSPTVFQFDVVETSRGAYAPRSVVRVGRSMFFLARDGFYVFDGASATPIGANKVDKTFLADLNVNKKNNVIGVADQEKQIVAWLYPSTASTDGTPDKIIIFNYSPNATKRWAWGDVDLEMAGQSITSYTLDELDQFGNVDTITDSFDSAVWSDRGLNIVVFDTNHKMGALNGPALTATVETGEFQPMPGVTRINRVLPLVDGGTHSVTMGYRFTQAGSVSWDTATSQLSSGTHAVRSTARFHRVRVSITGEFNHAIGLEVDAVRAGNR